ncbi:hypothetical protein Ccrd_018134, partial [Cynara cardunculus var. scolymus]
MEAINAVPKVTLIKYSAPDCKITFGMKLCYGEAGGYGGHNSMMIASEILRRVTLWPPQYDESCKLCSGESYCLSFASMVESVGDLKGGGLPYDGCQRFESAYLQLVNLADTKLYGSTQFFRFGGSIYDLLFMDIDKIHPFSSTLEWHNLKIAL